MFTAALLIIFTAAIYEIKLNHLRSITYSVCLFFVCLFVCLFVFADDIPSHFSPEKKCPNELFGESKFLIK